MSHNNLVILQIEESAKKAVEGANTASSAVKLYNKWQKLLAPESESESRSDATNVVADGGEGKEKKGLLHKFKNRKSKGDKSGEVVSILHVCSVCV